MIVDAGPYRVSVTEAGEGAPVVMVHSSGMSARQWKGLSRTLSARHRTLAPDLIDYGESSSWDPSRPDAMGDDLAAVAAVAKAAGAPAHLVGHSYGALLCLFTAAQKLAPVASLALYEPIAFGVLRARGEEESLWELDRAQGALLDPALAGTEEWLRAFVDYWNGPGAWDAMPAPNRARFGASARKMWHEVHAVGTDETPAEAYASIDVPTLILHGSETTTTERRVCSILAAAIPRARLHVIEGAGHMAPLTHPTAVHNAITTHLARA